MKAQLHLTQHPTECGSRGAECGISVIDSSPTLGLVGRVCPQRAVSRPATTAARWDRRALPITNTYDHLLRRTNLASVSPISQTLSATQYGYDNASRLSTVSDGTNSAHYGYLANSPLVESIAFKQSGTTRMTTTKSYDYVNRLTSIVSTPSADSAVAFTYQNNDANQRTRVDATDGSYWIYKYDSLGQVKSAKRYWADGTVAAGQQFEYGFDDIGNRKTAVSGGSQFSTSLRTNTYSANLLNQYTNRSVQGYVEVQGSAHSNATVTVNNESTYRKGDYFRKELSANNTSAAVWLGISNVAVLNGAGTNGTDIVSTKTGNVLIPKTPEVFAYDSGLIPVHHWITWNGGSADANSYAMLIQPGDGKVKSPAGYTGTPSTPTPLKLSPCDYDFKKLNECLTKMANSMNGQDFGMCWNLPTYLIEECKKESKGCTAP